MKVLLISFSDSTNIGDLLIVKSLESNLLEDEDVTVYSFNFNKKGDTVNIPKVTKNRLYSLVRKTNVADYFVNKIIRKNLIKKFSTSDIKNAIKECDFIVLGGGNTLFDLTKYSDSAFKIQLLFEEAKKHGKKIFVTSIGLGPFYNKKQEKKAIQTLKDAEYITVRDQKTLNYFINNDIRNAYLSVDPVFINTNKDTKNEIENKNTIGVNIMDLSLNKNSEGTIRKYEKAILNLINQLSNDKDNIIYLYCSEPRDQKTVDELYTKIRGKDNIVKINIFNEDDLFNLYKKLNYIVGTRMHSLIIGMTFEIPVIGISWQQKVCEMFKLFNLEEYCIELEDFNKNFELPIIKLNEIQNDGYAIQPREVLESAHAKFNINFELLDKIKGSIPNE